MDRNPALDGVRGVAIGLVLVGHLLDQLGVPNASGPIGVDLFFALSGFLITGILLRSRDRAGYWSRFYGRRARRILPIYALLLAVVGSVRVAGLDHEAAAPWWVYGLMAQNWWNAGHGWGTPLLCVTWSLCVEEQFYAAWPWVVRLCSRQALVAAAVVAVLAAPVLRAWVGPSAYVLTPCRLDVLLLGAVAAVAGPGFELWALGAVAAGGGVLAVSLVPGASALQSSGVGLVGAGLVYTAAHQTISALAVWPLRWLGRVSYCLYLVHMPLLHVLGWPGLAVALVVSELSWRFVESPILATRIDRRRIDNIGGASCESSAQCS